jgi:hypothetical protein
VDARNIPPERRSEIFPGEHRVVGRPDLGSFLRKRASVTGPGKPVPVAGSAGHSAVEAIGKL